MRLLIGVLPSIFILAANLLLLVYPLTRARYAETLEQIKQMEAAGETK
jgi:Na+/melibiose symporter-like transporter